ncbi:MAG: universal stress protein, partial [Polyangiaceae bacterium]|nr:universal stress protein [Polyangiaceae bacterium]
GEAFVAVGPPDDEIARLAARLPADLVVVGRRGRTRLNRIALGSVAETLTRTAPCSVLVVRMHPET